MAFDLKKKKEPNHQTSIKQNDRVQPEKSWSKHGKCLISSCEQLFPHNPYFVCSLTQTSCRIPIYAFLPIKKLYLWIDAFFAFKLPPFWILFRSWYVKRILIRYWVCVPAMIFTSPLECFEASRKTMNWGWYILLEINWKILIDLFINLFRKKTKTKILFL